MTEAQKEVAAKGRNVQMVDGTVVNFGEKTRMKKELITDNPAEPAVKFLFDNGEIRTYPVHADLITYAAAHGLAQRLGDSVANSKDLVIEDVIQAIDETHAGSIAQGLWRSPREAAGGSTKGEKGASLLAKALAEYSGKSVQEVNVLLAGKSNAEKAALRQHAAIKAIITRLEEEKAAKSDVDGGAVLDSMFA